MYVEGGDETSTESRRFSNIMSLRLDDLGDADMLSENQISLLRRASALERLEGARAVMSTGVGPRGSVRRHGIEWSSPACLTAVAGWHER